MKKRRIGKRTERGARRLAKNRNFVRWLIDEEIKRLAPDRATHFGNLAIVWEDAATNLLAATDALYRHDNVAITARHISAFLRPYDILTLHCYGALIDRLDEDEERRFRELAKNLENAWRRIADALLDVRMISKDGADALFNDASAINSEIAALFTGDMPPRISLGYKRRMDRIKAAFPEKGAGA